MATLWTCCGGVDEKPKERRGYWKQQDVLSRRMEEADVVGQDVPFTKFRPGKEWQDQVELSRSVSLTGKYTIGRTVSQFAFHVERERCRELQRFDSLAFVLGERNRLEKRLHRLNLRQIEMSDDGNCQFRAISKQLYGTQRYHGQVRARVVEHMLYNLQDFAPFLGGEAQAKRYLKTMAMNRTWGDELTLRACADSHRVTIHVITSSPENWYLRYPPAFQEPKKHIYIAYISPIHYNSIAPR